MRKIEKTGNILGTFEKGKKGKRIVYNNDLILLRVFVAIYKSFGSSKLVKILRELVSANFISTKLQPYWTIP